MRVSIVTVCLNARATLAEAMASVLGQTHQDIEYVVKDGGSTDGSVELVRSFGDKVGVFETGPDQGLYDALNKGLALCSGDVVGFLHADDLYASPEAVARVAACFARTGADSVHGDLVYVDRDDPSIIRRYWKSRPHAPGLFLRGFAPPHPAFFVKRSVYERLGGFNTDLGTAADYELMLRFLHVGGISNAHIQEILVRMREGGVSNQSLANRLKAHRQDRRAWAVNKVRPGLFTLWMKPLSKLGQFLRRPDA